MYGVVERSVTLYRATSIIRSHRFDVFRLFQSAEGAANISVRMIHGGEKTPELNLEIARTNWEGTLSCTPD